MWIAGIEQDNGNIEWIKSKGKLARYCSWNDARKALEKKMDYRSIDVGGILAKISSWGYG